MQSISDFIKESRRYEDELVGIETENRGDESLDEDPYSPDDVRISQKMFSVYQVYHWIEENVLFLSPEFQRNICGWMRRNYVFDLSHFIYDITLRPVIWSI